MTGEWCCSDTLWLISASSRENMATSSDAELDSPPPIGTDVVMTASKDGNKSTHHATSAASYQHYYCEFHVCNMCQSLCKVQQILWQFLAKELKAKMTGNTKAESRHYENLCEEKMLRHPWYNLPTVDVHTVDQPQILAAETPQIVAHQHVLLMLQLDIFHCP